MAQYPKEEMRRAIVAAAADELAELGFEKATLSSIAKRAGTSIGNVYKYFAGKDELFAAAIPQETSRELESLIRARVQALDVERDVRSLAPSHAYAKAADALFAFVVVHRAQIAFLLGRAEGTAYASFAEDLAHGLTKMGSEYFSRAYPGATLSASRRRALLRVYRGFLAAMTDNLREEKSERALRDATDHFTTYHLAGLKAFFESASQESAGLR